MIENGIVNGSGLTTASTSVNLNYALALLVIIIILAAFWYFAVWKKRNDIKVRAEKEKETLEQATKKPLDAPKNLPMTMAEMPMKAPSITPEATPVKKTDILDKFMNKESRPTGTDEVNVKAPDVVSGLRARTAPRVPRPVLASMRPSPGGKTPEPSSPPRNYWFLAVVGFLAVLAVAVFAAPHLHLVPQPTPYPSPTPVVTYVYVTVTPVPTGAPAIVNGSGGNASASPTSTPTPTPLPTPWPTLSPTVTPDRSDSEYITILDPVDYDRVVNPQTSVNPGRLAITGYSYYGSAYAYRGDTFYMRLDYQAMKSPVNQVRVRFSAVSADGNHTLTDSNQVEYWRLEPGDSITRNYGFHISNDPETEPPSGVYTIRLNVYNYNQSTGAYSDYCCSLVRKLSVL